MVWILKVGQEDDETLHPGFYEYLVEIYKNCEGNGQWDKARWSSRI